MADIQTTKDNPEWLIKRIDNLGLCYKTFIGRIATDKDLEICAFNSDGSVYTIASFDYDEYEKHYLLNSCGDRLNSKRIDWEVFGLLVQKGYNILENGIKSREN